MACASRLTQCLGLEPRPSGFGSGSARVTSVTSGQLDWTVGQEAERLLGEKGGLKVILDMAKLKIPFQLTCTVTSGKLIRENPDTVRRMVRAMAETVHYYKNNKDEVIKVLHKYTRGQERSVLEKSYTAFRDLLVDDTYPTIEGLRNILEIQAEIDPKAAKVLLELGVDRKRVREETLKLLEEAGIKLAGHGVHGFTKDHEANKKLFEFAKKAGVKLPAPARKAILFALSERDGGTGGDPLKLAIHNFLPLFW